MPHTSEIPLSSSATWRDGARGGGDVRVRDAWVLKHFRV